MTFRIKTAQEYFDRLDERFDPAAARGTNAIFQWNLKGAGTWHAIVDGENLTVGEGEHDNPTVTITMKEDHYVKMANGDLNGQMAVLTGKMKLGGQRMIAMKMRNIFPIAT